MKFPIATVQKTMLLSLFISFLSACGAGGNNQGMLPPASLLGEGGSGRLVQTQGRPGAQAGMPGEGRGHHGMRPARLPHELIDAVLADPELAEGFEALKGLPPEEHHQGLLELLADHPDLLELIPDVDAGEMPEAGPGMGPMPGMRPGGRPEMGPHRIQHLAPRDCPEKAAEPDEPEEDEEEGEGGY